MDESKKMGSSILYGIITIFIVFIICSFIFSILLKFTTVQESSIQFIVTAISFITLFVGGFVSGGKGKQKGWLLGGLTGLVFSLIIFLFQFLGYDRLFNVEQLIYHICYILTAMMGGILGVNMTNKSRVA
ncbi:TIGR04086 family membrane protein [Bacillus massilinigeriensis]|uniref:TIGR04086 family membrane protein n=1 Tax=Bacillus massilionigeriensis TaxID=1805475 RepID=UPI00096B342B|nr:TIGR04086 family membrane protein [Bacillus massilionigeriensis]